MMADRDCRCPGNQVMCKTGIFVCVHIHKEDICSSTEDFGLPLFLARSDPEMNNTG